MASLELIEQIDRASQSLQESATLSWGDIDRVKLLASANRLVASLERTEDRAWEIITAVSFYPELQPQQGSNLHLISLPHKLRSWQSFVWACSKLSVGRNR